MRDWRRMARVSIACTLATFLPGAAYGQVVTEAEAVARALAESARLRAARARPAQVVAEQQLRRLQPNPVVTFQQERAAGVTDRFLLVEHQFPLSGRLGLLSRAADAAVIAAERRVNRTEFEIRQDTRAAFTELLAAQARLDDLSKTLMTLRTLAGRLAEREGAGDGSRFDRLRAEREVAEVAAERTLAEANLAAARAALAALLGMSGELSLVASGAIESTGPVPVLEPLLAAARSRRPDLLALESEIQRFELDHQASSRLGRPQLILGGGWKQTGIDHAGASGGSAFSAGLTLPFFNRGQAESAVASAGLIAARAERDALAIDIEHDVRGAHARTLHLQKVLADYERDALERSRELVRIATVAYDEGELGILELLDAHRSLVNAELRAMEFKAAARLAAIALERAVGEEITR
jgi:cobalt-zinc-cadmium efflux system outer membrane protein